MLTHLLARLVEGAAEKWPAERRQVGNETFNFEVVERIASEISQVEEFLKEEPDLSQYNCARLNLGPGGHVWLHHRDLSQRLLFVAFTETPAAATAALEKSVLLDHVPVVGIYALAGIELPGELRLGSDLRLVPFEMISESSQRSRLVGPYWRGALGAQHGRPTAAFVREHEVRPKLLNAPRDLATVVSAYADREVQDACRCLSLIADARPVEVARWCDLPQTMLLGQAYAGTMASRIQDSLTLHSIKLSESDLLDFGRLHGEFELLTDSDKAKLRLPLDRLNQALRRALPVDQAIDIGTSLEALLLSEGTENQLSLSFSLRGAWLLGRSVEERVEIYSALRGLYQMRSQAVHTGKVKPHWRIGGTEIDSRDLISRGFKLARDAIRQVIRDGRYPLWTQLVLGGQ